MGYLIDTHCHLHEREFFTEEQAEKAVIRARERNVKKIICIGTSHENSLEAREFAKAHEGVYWTYGVHPELASEPWQRNDTVFANPKMIPVAIGEVGLDYRREGYSRDDQIRLFEEMLQLATDYDLPLSFHVREAFVDFFPVVANFPGVRGVVHSFTDSKRTLRRILEETGFFVGVNGLATYSTLPTPPIERILLETDAPFLTPVPFRGIINESGYIREIAQWLSTKLDLDYEIIEKETTKNARELFHI